MTLRDISRGVHHLRRIKSVDKSVVFHFHPPILPVEQFDLSRTHLIVRNGLLSADTRSVESMCNNGKEIWMLLNDGNPTLLVKRILGKEDEVIKTFPFFRNGLQHSFAYTRQGCNGIVQSAVRVNRRWCWFNVHLFESMLHINRIGKKSFENR